MVLIGLSLRRNLMEEAQTVDVWELSDRMELVMTHSAEIVNHASCFTADLLLLYYQYFTTNTNTNFYLVY